MLRAECFGRKSAGESAHPCSLPPYVGERDGCPLAQRKGQRIILQIFFKPKKRRQRPRTPAPLRGHSASTCRIVQMGISLGWEDADGQPVSVRHSVRAAGRTQDKPPAFQLHRRPDFTVAGATGFSGKSQSWGDRETTRLTRPAGGCLPACSVFSQPLNELEARRRAGLKR